MTAPTDETLPAASTEGGDYPQMVRVDPQHYVVKEEIARGGMGRIRIARDRRLGRRIARQDPTNAAWQRDLSVSHEQVGDLLLEGGDTAGALAEYRASLVIAKASRIRRTRRTAWTSPRPTTSSRRSTSDAAKRRTPR